MKEETFKELATKAEDAFSTQLDFTNNSSLAKTINLILDYLYKFRIGPAVLSLLVVFCFPEKNREKIWNSIKEIIRENN